MPSFPSSDLIVSQLWIMLTELTNLLSEAKKAETSLGQKLRVFGPVKARLFAASFQEIEAGRGDGLWGAWYV